MVKLRWLHMRSCNVITCECDGNVSICVALQPYNILAEPIKRAKKLGYTLSSHVLDVEHVDLASGEILEQGPMLVITFQTQEIGVMHDKSGKVVEGDPVSLGPSPRLST